MNIGGQYEVIQHRTGYRYLVTIIRPVQMLSGPAYVGLTANDSPQWSAGAHIAIMENDLVTPA